VFEFFEELFKKIVLSILTRLILNVTKHFFNNPDNKQFYLDSFDAAILLFMSTSLFITTILLTTLAAFHGFTLIKFIILLVILSFTVVTFIEHKKITKKYNF
jgi:hypothetical protein